MADIDSTIPQKQCTLCEKWFPATREYFYEDQRVKSGLTARCKLCVSKKATDRERNLRLDNPDFRKRRTEQVRINMRRHRAKPGVREKLNKDKRERLANDLEYRARINQKQRERLQDPEIKLRYRAKQREWAHSEIGRANSRLNSHIRRAAKLKMSGSYTLQDATLQYKSQRGKCWHCGKPLNGKYHLDHLIPLTRGGSNNPDNIVCSCQFCNLSKNNKLCHEWNGKLF